MLAVGVHARRGLPRGLVRSYHCVAPVTRGERRVLVVEFWIGEARTCAHRCEHHFAPCDYTATESFWRRALANIAGGTVGGGDF